MNKAFKIIIIILVLSILGIGGYWAFLTFQPKRIREIKSIIPSDAIFMFETNNATKGWEKIRNTQLWTSLTENQNFEEFNNLLLKADSSIHNNKALDLIFSNRKMVISAHMISGIDYDFIIAIDVEYVSKITPVFKGLQMFGYSVNERKYKTEKIIEIKDNTEGTTYYVTIIDNLLIGSLSNLLIEDLILQQNESHWNNQDFISATNGLNEQKVIKFYFNYSRLPKFIRNFYPDENDVIHFISNSLAYSAFQADIIDNLIQMEGASTYNENASFIKTFSSIAPGKYQSLEILPTNTAFCLSLTFNNFGEAYESFETYYSKNNPEEFKSYNKQIRNIERELDINIQEGILSWIGEEITVAKTNPKYGNRDEDLLLLIHSKDVDDAKIKLNQLAEQIEKTAPIKIKSQSYKNYDINYLNIKGLFKMLFGNLFESIEKPYYTIIEDYVVFSNSDKTIIDLINHYIKGNTLSHKPYFMEFKDNFNVKSNLSLFIQTPHIFRHIYQNSNKEFKDKLLENKDLYLSFNLIGLQLISDGQLIKTKFYANYDKNTLFNLELEELEISSADELFNSEYETLEFVVQIPEEELQKQGNLKVRYENDIVKHEGKLKDGLPTGLWRTYFDNGNIKSAVNYEKGEVDGDCVFFYNITEQPVKAEVKFENDELIGAYKEYYKNGNQKAYLNYKNGKLDGESLFYYENEILKIKGEYKKGFKSGKWEYYRENGEVYEKEKWKKGNKK